MWVYRDDDDTLRGCVIGVHGRWMQVLNVANSVIPFIEEWLGIADSGDTPGNKGQCVGLIELWCDVHQHPHIAGNAVDLLRLADRSAYEVVINNPTNYPPPGAIVCWDSSWGGGFGHCAVVVAAQSMQVVVFEQNNPSGSAPRVATHGYVGVAGWLVLK